MKNGHFVQSLRILGLRWMQKYSLNTITYTSDHVLNLKLLIWGILTYSSSSSPTLLVFISWKFVAQGLLGGLFPKKSLFSKKSLFQKRVFISTVHKTFFPKKTFFGKRLFSQKTPYMTLFPKKKPLSKTLGHKISATLLHFFSCCLLLKVSKCTCRPRLVSAHTWKLQIIMLNKFLCIKNCFNCFKLTMFHRRDANFKYLYKYFS